MVDVVQFQLRSKRMAQHRFYTMCMLNRHHRMRNLNATGKSRPQLRTCWHHRWIQVMVNVVQFLLRSMRMVQHRFYTMCKLNQHHMQWNLNRKDKNPPSIPRGHTCNIRGNCPYMMRLNYPSTQCWTSKSRRHQYTMRILDQRRREPNVYNGNSWTQVRKCWHHRWIQVMVDVAQFLLRSRRMAQHRFYTMCKLNQHHRQLNLNKKDKNLPSIRMSSCHRWIQVMVDAVQFRWRNRRKVRLHFDTMCRHHQRYNRLVLSMKDMLLHIRWLTDCHTRRLLLEDVEQLRFRNMRKERLHFCTKYMWNLRHMCPKSSSLGTTIALL